MKRGKGLTFGSLMRGVVGVFRFGAAQALLEATPGRLAEPYHEVAFGRRPERKSLLSDHRSFFN